MLKVSLLLILIFSSTCGALDGQTCNPDHEKLDPSTYKTSSDCDYKSYCSVSANNGTCVPRVCRRDIYAFGYPADETPPPLCPEDSFCPDKGDGCRARVPVGQPCELGRDEQCIGADPVLGLSDWHNADGAVCLKSVCVCVVRFDSTLCSS